MKIKVTTDNIFNDKKITFGKFDVYESVIGRITILKYNKNDVSTFTFSKKYVPGLIKALFEIKK